MKSARVEANFVTKIKKVWDVITNLHDMDWRPGIQRVDIDQDGLHYTELTDDGKPVYFTVIEKIPFQSYGYQMKSKDYSGSVHFHLSETPEGGTRLTMEQSIEYGNVFLSFLSLGIISLEKIANRYIYDLKRKLGES